MAYFDNFDLPRTYQQLIDAKAEHRTQEEIFADIKSILKTIKEKSLLLHVMRMHVELGHRSHNELFDGLDSPMKQSLYLLDVYYNIENRTETDELDDKVWKKLKPLLAEMEMCLFVSIGFPNEGDLYYDDRDKMVEVSLSTFLFIYANTRLCFDEQVRDRIVGYLKPYDDKILKEFGFSVDDILEFELHVRSLSNQKYSDIMSQGFGMLYCQQHPDEWQKLTAKFIARGLPPNTWQFQPELKSKIDGYGKMLTTNPGSICFHSLSDLRACKIAPERFDNISKFLMYDTASPSGKMVYYSSKRIIEDTPLVKCGEEYMCPIGKMLLESFYYRINERLQKNESSGTTYKKRKDRLFEKIVCNLFKRFFPEKTKFFTSYSVDGITENDLLIIYDDACIIVEMKDCNFRPPLFDPQKAYVKIKSDFDDSVQYGCDQCKRVEDYFDKGGNIDILDANDNMNLLYTLRTSKIEQVYSVVVTDFKYGPIQTDLGKMLTGVEGESRYPWSVCVDDLEIFLIMLKRLHKGIAPSRFLEFLDYREAFHTRLLCFDELEMCGWYLCDRNQFKTCADSDEIVTTFPGMAEIFDAYYKVGYGFDFEYDINAKKYYKLPDYARTFDIKVINKGTFANEGGV